MHWIQLSDEELEVIQSALSHLNLHGLNFLLKTQFSTLSPYNIKHNKANAIKAAQTYFSADDLIINEDYVRWESNGDALVMAWQRVPKDYIPEEDFDCGCNKEE